MRKWYEWVDSQTLKDNTLGDFVCMNLYKETQCIRDWIEIKRCVGTNYRCFDGPVYVQQIIKNNPNLEISTDTLDQWINDPEYKTLLNESGQITIIENMPVFIRNMFIKNVREKIKVNWDTAKIEITVQQPGQMFPLHYDRLKSQDFGVGYDEENSIQRWLIMLYDQKPGQTFLMNNQYVNWQAGDVITWSHTQHAHGSSNFGYYPRYNLKLTANTIDN